MDGADDRPRIGQGDALANAVSAAGPTGVDQPHVRVVLLHFFCELLGVFPRVPHEKGRAKAGRERRLWLGDAHFRARDFGGVPADEVVHRSFGCEFAHRRQNAKGIAGQKDDVFWMPARTGDLCIGNVLDGIGRAGVLRDGIIVVIDHAGHGVKNHVFEHGAKADGIVNLGFTRAGKADALGVTTAFKIEDAALAPTVLVIADEAALRIRRQGGFAGAGQAKKERGVALFAHIGRAVHGQNVLFGQEVIEHGEDALFHFAGVFRAQNDHFSKFKAEVDAGGRGHFGGVQVGGKPARVDDGIIGFAKIFEFCARGPHEHVVHEQGLVRAGADHAHFDAVFGIPTRVPIHDIDAVANIEIVNSAHAVDEKGVLVEFDVDLAPPDVARAVRVFHDALVAWAAPGFFARAHDQGPSAGDGGPGFMGEGFLVEHRGRGISQHRGLGDVVAFQTKFCHVRAPLI